MKSRLTKDQLRSQNDSYVESVLSGRRKAGQLEHQAVERFVRDLAHWPLQWDAPLKAINFLRRSIQHIKGPLAGQPFRALDWQVFLAVNLFGFVRPDTGLRRFTSAYIEGPKGTGKSPLLADLGLYCLGLDSEPKPECFIIGRVTEQAAVAFDYPLTNVRQSPALQRHFKIIGGDNAYRIDSRRNGGFLVRSTGSQNEKAEGRSGPNVHYALIDEYHEHRSAALKDKMELGVKDRQQPLIIVSTNAGQTTSGPCYDEHRTGRDILNQSIESDSHFVLIFAVDDDDDPLNDEGCWEKAHPSLPDAPGLEYLRDRVAKAQGKPALQALVLRLCFGRWTEALHPFFDVEALKRAWVAPGAWEDAPAGSRAFAVMDLSSVRKLTSITVVAEDEQAGRLKCRSRSWVVGEGLLDRQVEEGIPLYDWAESDESELMALPEPSIDYAVICETLREWADYYDLQCVASDSYRRSDFTDALEAAGIEWTRDHRRAGPGVLLFGDHGMNHYTESKKSQEPQQDGSVHFFMPRSVDFCEQVLAQDRIDIRFDPLLRYSLLACMASLNFRGDRILIGESEVVCTDPAQTLVGAIGVACHFDAQVGRESGGRARLARQLADRGKERKKKGEQEDAGKEERTEDRSPPRRVSRADRLRAAQERIRDRRGGRSPGVE